MDTHEELCTLQIAKANAIAVNATDGGLRIGSIFILTLEDFRVCVETVRACGIVKRVENIKYRRGRL